PNADSGKRRKHGKTGKRGKHCPRRSRRCVRNCNPSPRGHPMTGKAPPTRHKFRSIWDEIQYLYHKMLFWFYQRQNAGNASRYIPRLESLLRKASPHHEAILGEACWSLIFEVKGQPAKAIPYRENEIRLIRKLMECDAPPEVKYDPGDLSDRLDLLAMLYRNAGDLDRAVALLQESRSLCEKHGLPFDGQDLLKDFLLEKQQATEGRAGPCGGRARSSA